MSSRIRVVSTRTTPRRRKTYYEMLGVPQSATHEQITEAVGVMQHEHSESSGDAKFGFEDAIRTLTDPERRRHYDMRLDRHKGIVGATRMALPSKTDPLEPKRQKLVISENTKSGQSASSRTIEPIDVLGINGHTRVVEGWQFDASRRVVVKQLSGNHRKEPYESEFADEATFLSRMSCPHIVEVYSVNLKRGFYVMEYVDGQLADTVRAGRSIDEKQAVTWLRQALMALSMVHQSEQFIGRLCANSFLVTAAGDLKLKDAPASNQTGTLGRPRGNLVCVAPELLSPNTFGNTGPHSDLYAVGFLMLQLMAGRRFVGWFKSVGKRPTPALWMNWHGSAAEVLPSIRTLLPAISPDLAEVLEKMTAKRVKDRYQSANSVLEDLDKFEVAVKREPMPSASQDPSDVEASPLAIQRSDAAEDDPPNLFAEPESEEAAIAPLLSLNHMGVLLSRVKRAKTVLGVGGTVALAFALLSASSFSRDDDPVPDYQPAFSDGPAPAQADSSGGGLADDGVANASDGRNQSSPQPSPTTLDTSSDSLPDRLAERVNNLGSSYPSVSQANLKALAAVQTAVGTQVTDSSALRERNGLRPQEPATSRGQRSSGYSTVRLPVEPPRTFDVPTGRRSDRDQLSRLLSSALTVHVEGNIRKKRALAQKLLHFGRTVSQDPRALFAAGCLARGPEQLEYLRLAGHYSSKHDLGFLQADQTEIELALRSQYATDRILGKLLVLRQSRSERNLHSLGFYAWYGKVIAYLDFNGSPAEKGLIRKHLEQLPKAYVARQAFTQAHRQTIKEFGLLVRTTGEVSPRTFFPIDYAMKIAATQKTLPSDSAEPGPARHVVKSL